MNRLRIRVSLNKGKRGIYLDKLERILAETRKFLSSIGEDINLDDPSVKWVGLDFKNGSLSYTAEYPLPVRPPQQKRFNDGVISLAQKKRPAFIKASTASQFYAITEPLDAQEKMKLGVYQNGNGKPQWLDLSREIAADARTYSSSSIQYVGAAQGIIHSLYKEAGQPFFYLRDLSSDALIKCVYDRDYYERIAAALRLRDQVVHVHGIVTANVVDRTIDSIKIDKIISASAFTMKDVEDFLHPEAAQ